MGEKAAFPGVVASDCGRRNNMFCASYRKIRTQRGDLVKSRFPLTSFCLAFFLSSAFAQTYDLNGNGAAPPKSSHETVSSAQSEDQQPSPGGSGFGWGSSIEVSRQARAAQDALKRGDHKAAVVYAENAAKAAPQNADLWFLLGYADRLADHYQLSVDAYNRGLKLKPHSTNGMAGLAQTLARMGRIDEAEQMLKKVMEANPNDAGSTQLAGELLMNSDPAQALELLKRADMLQYAPHTDLLIAHTYERLGQPDQYTHYLDRARKHAPNDPEVMRAVAGQYRDRGQFDQAIATLQAIPNKDVDIEAELAYTYQLAGKQQDAADLYVRLARAARGNIGLDLSAAQAMVALGKDDEARGFLEDAKKIDANNYRLHAIQGAVAENDDRFDDAATEYKLALGNLPAVVPEGPLYPIELQLNLYELDLRQDNEPAAKQQLDSAMAAIHQVNVPPGSRPEMLRLRAAIESGSGNLEAANKDLQEALALAPSNINSLLNFASLQWKLGQKNAAEATFSKVLELDRNNRTALSSLGYLARDKGDAKLAESYFRKAIAAHPKDYAPYLALGDLYTATQDYRAAQTSYEAAYKRMPGNSMTIAGGANAALEAHNRDLAKQWLDRAQGKMNDSPPVMRERERYLTLKGEYEQSAKLGYKVIEKLPHDREGAVYLAYDLYYLNRYDEAMALIKKFEPILPDDKDLPLVAGNIHAHQGTLKEALSDYNRALELDPKLAEGYVNRGFVLNDLRQPAKASQDFQAALQIQGDYGEAHLGLGFADLQLHRPRPALRQLDAAQKILGKSHALHLARAEAYRQQQDFAHAEPEYRTALQETPNDLTTELAYADTLFRLRRYQQSLSALDVAQKLSATDARVYAMRAQVHAKTGAREDALHDIQLAEQYGRGDVDILMSTGGSLLLMGDRDAAMKRFTQALDTPNGDRLGVRLAVAEVFMRQGHYDEVQRQLALGFAEARIDQSPVSPEDILQAANIFLASHQFDLAETYFDKARLAGANPRTVEIGLANTYVAEGETHKAADALASLGPATDFTDDYDYMIAAGNLYRQQQNTVQALSSFAQANTVAGQDNQAAALTAQNELAIAEGRQINQTVSILPEASFAPALEDINVYTLDAKILRVTNPALLPPPRHSFQSLADSHYRLHFAGLPVITGFVGESFTQGRFLFPSVNVVQNRNTYDTYLNGGITPILHLGPNSIAFNGGLQFDIRRDTTSPTYLSQNLFRQFLYVSSSSFKNWIAFNGSAIHEAGPFTERSLNSRDIAATLEFTVGRPWGRTSLITGYTVRDLLFHPLVQEYFNTSTYLGLQHRFGTRLTAAVLAEDLRSWRVQATEYAIAQAWLPGGRFEFRASPKWNVQGSFLLSRGQGFHQYDNAQSEFAVAYTRAARGTANGTEAGIPAYPFRFSFGVQQQTFYSFAGGSRTTILPVIHFTLF
jgi:tetratricopeptide (TPR) repeat protein